MGIEKSPRWLALLNLLLLAVCASLAQAQTPTFLARTDYYDQGAKAMVLADFNGDGILDIAYLDGGEPLILLGNGDGAFSPGPLVKGLVADECIATGDFNGDGNVDIVVADLTGTVQVGYGNGNGTFQPGPVISGIGTYSLTVADVNGDALPDILVGATTGLLVFLNQGAGVFGPYTTLLPGDDVLATAVADVNGDGIADIVAGMGEGAQVLLGTGGGNFQNGQSITLQHAAGSLVLADMNGDGKADLVASAGPPPYDPLWTEVSVLLGSGNGTFAPHSHVSIPEGVSGVMVGDINRDGHPDLAILQGGEYQISVAFNLGNATFAAPLAWATADTASSFGIGPLRKPGLIDMVVAGNFGDFLSVLLNEGHGTFEDGAHIAMSAPPGPFASADFNADGSTDLAVLIPSGVSIYENSGKGYGPFTQIGSYTLTNPNWIVTADFNKDGKPDLAVSLAGGGVAILLGVGGGQFAAPVTLSSGASSMIAVGDFNEDGKVDIVATSNQIFFGNGDGTFAAPQALVGGTVLNSITWLTPIHADLNNNRYLDLAVLDAVPEYDRFYMLINNGKGTFFLNKKTVAEVMPPAELAVADFNGDGLPDLMLNGGGLQAPLLGNGDGTFQLLSSLDCQVCFLAGGGVTTGDFNGDGKADFAVTTGQNIEVFLGNGDATFQNPFMVGTAPGSGFLQYLELQKSSPGPRFAFVTSSGDEIDIEIETAK
jgi:hypothetical protein